MRTVRRLYFYAVALVSLEVVLWGLITLLRSMFCPVNAAMGIACSPEPPLPSKGPPWCKSIAQGPSILATSGPVCD